MDSAAQTMLAHWRAKTEPTGHRLPSQEELGRIAHQGRVGPNDSDSARSWKATIDYLIAQANFGVSPDVVQLSPQLMQPQPLSPATDAGPVAAPAAPAPADPGSGDDVQFGKLTVWRAQAVHEGRLKFGTVSDLSLRTLTRSRITQAGDIGKRVAVLAPFSEEVFAILDGRADRPARESADPVPAAAPHVAEPDRTSAPAPEMPRHAPAAADANPVTSDAEVEAAAGEQLIGGDELEAAIAGLSGKDFVVSYGIAPDPAEVHGRISVSTTDDGARLSWPAATEAGVTVHRVVLGDGERPPVPEYATTLALTARTNADVPLAVKKVLAHLQVWSYHGASLAEAMATQPVLHAEGVVVKTVPDVDLRAEAGQVRGMWVAPEGASRVRIYRIPGPVAPAHIDEQSRIHATEDNLGGFFDADASGSVDFVYRLIVEVGAGAATQLSDPVDIHVEMPISLLPVSDIAHTITRAPTKDHPGQVDLTFTMPPHGQVRVYRLSEGVRGIAGEAMSVDALEGAGLQDEHRVVTPMLPGPAGKVTMHAVHWPPTHAALTFVPVTVAGSQAIVGTPVKVLGIGTPGTPRLRDRVDEQILTFTWPAGAAEVHVHLAERGATVDQIASSREFARIDPVEYERNGGWRLQLPPVSQELDLILTGVRGSTHRGVPSRVSYSPLLVLEYAVSLGRVKGFFGPPKATFSVWKGRGESTGSPPFVLVFNPDRLPLTPTDGTVVPAVLDATPDMTPVMEVRPQGLTAGPSDAMKWRASPPGKTGYVRLFLSASVQPETRRRVALIDPPVTSLRIG